MSRVEYDKVKNPAAFFNTGEPFPFIKMSFEGGPGSGKSYTAGVVARGILKVKQKSGHTKPRVIAIDTEQALKFWRPLLTDDGLLTWTDPGDPNNQLFVLSTDPATGANPSLADVCRALDWANEGNADLIIIDSLTKIHRDFVAAYRDENLKGRKIEFRDWPFVKEAWRDNFVERAVHCRADIIWCGRLANVYDFIGEEGGKKEIKKTGTKFAGDSEVAYEADINVHMERKEEIGRKDPKGKDLQPRVWHMATILKSRFPKYDGRVFNLSGQNKGPVFADFEEAIRFVIGDGKEGKAVERTANTEIVKQAGNPEDVRQGEIYIQRLMGALDQLCPPDMKDRYYHRGIILGEAFNGETSIEAIKTKPTDELERGWRFVRAKVDALKGPAPQPGESFFDGPVAP